MEPKLLRLGACLSLLAAVCSLPQTAIAHDIWLTPAGDSQNRRVVVNYGHPDDRMPVAPDKIVDIVAITASGERSIAKKIKSVVENGISVAITEAFADEGGAEVAARYDNGYWVKLADKSYRNATPRLVPRFTDSLWSGKFAKAFVGAKAPWQRTVGHELELVPLQDPGGIKPGEMFRLQVLYRGKPLPDAEIELGDGVTHIPEKDMPRFVADRAGIASVKIAKAGPQLMSVDHRVTPSTTPDHAKADVYSATLWFSVP